MEISIGEKTYLFHADKKIGKNYFFVPSEKMFLLYATGPGRAWQRSKQNNDNNKTRISRFSAYALAIFTEHTAWTAVGEMSRSALEICLLFVITDMQMRYHICVFSEDRHVGNTCTHHNH